MPAANFKIWWDGDLLGEILNNTNVTKWGHQGNRSTSIFSASGCRNTWRNAPPFYGDVLGDWREEVLWETSDYSELRLYSSKEPTEERLYTLAHNPGYRACLSVKGYYQSNLVDYYLGDGMSDPSVPDISVVGNPSPIVEKPKSSPLASRFGFLFKAVFKGSPLTLPQPWAGKVTSVIICDLKGNALLKAEVNGNTINLKNQMVPT